MGYCVGTGDGAKVGFVLTSKLISLGSGCCITSPTGTIFSLLSLFSQWTILYGIKINSIDPILRQTKNDVNIIFLWLFCSNFFSKLIFSLIN